MRHTVLLAACVGFVCGVGVAKSEAWMRSYNSGAAIRMEPGQGTVLMPAIPAGLPGDSQQGRYQRDLQPEPLDPRHGGARDPGTTAAPAIQAREIGAREIGAREMGAREMEGGGPAVVAQGQGAPSGYGGYYPATPTHPDAAARGFGHGGYGQPSPPRGDGIGCPGCGGGWNPAAAAAAGAAVGAATGVMIGGAAGAVAPSPAYAPPPPAPAPPIHAAVPSGCSYDILANRYTCAGGLTLAPVYGPNGISYQVVPGP
ncbi:hypothetical protein [Rhodopila sp.]|jgi:hypothetical protein|uniref:hypothetical protein n=1 Tax=Rhodopila sp. TaxID=2480087 RepID=UPI002C0DB6CC|nr:hypothetical protein [Rhodopila sp.]HVZ10235.1 hypothetical protein [Rhodopila sp.]